MAQVDSDDSLIKSSHIAVHKSEGRIFMLNRHRRDGEWIRAFYNKTLRCVPQSSWTTRSTAYVEGLWNVKQNPSVCSSVLVNYQKHRIYRGPLKREETTFGTVRYYPYTQPSPKFSSPFPLSEPRIFKRFYYGPVTYSILIYSSGNDYAPKRGFEMIENIL